MEPNTQPLGDDMRDDDRMADTEPTPAEEQGAPFEQPAESEMPQAESRSSEPTSAEEEVEEAAEPAAETEGEPVEEAPAEEAPAGAVEPVAEPLAAKPAAETEGEPAEEVPAEEAPAGAVELVAEPLAAEPTADALQPVEAAEPPAEEQAAPAEPPLFEAEGEAEPAPADAAVPEPEAESAPFKRGDIITGVVVETSPTEVLVDVGEGLIGVVASRELERMDRSALEALRPGNEVEVYVLKLKGGDGRPVLSLARAEEESNWRLAEEHYETKKVYFSKVAGYNKGGLIVRFGKVRGFVPASQVSRERQRRAAGENPEDRWGVMVGEDIAVKVVEIDRARNRLILSERAAAREWRERQKSHLLEDLEVGDVRTGRVISVADFGAFVDLGGADGLVHLTELSWQHITHPRDAVEVGQEVEVEVINIDRDRKRIGLSMKRQANDPWQEIVQAYQVGQLVQATVTKLTKFGAFARLVDTSEIEGLIHISELADYRVTHPKEVVLVGDVLTLRIVKIEADQRRLGLSLRQVDSAKFMDQDWDALADELGYGSEMPEVAATEPVASAAPDDAGVEGADTTELDAPPPADRLDLDLAEVQDELAVEEEDAAEDWQPELDDPGDGEADAEQAEPHAEVEDEDVE